MSNETDLHMCPCCGWPVEFHTKYPAYDKNCISFLWDKIRRVETEYRDLLQRVDRIDAELLEVMSK